MQQQFYSQERRGHFYSEITESKEFVGAAMATQTGEKRACKSSNLGQLLQLTNIDSKQWGG